MIADLTDHLLDSNQELRMAPGNIMVAGDSFLIVSDKGTDDFFVAPEGNVDQMPTQAQTVWSIGALIYYASTSRILFGGHGGSYQRLHPGVSLPVLPKNHQGLTPIMQRCLCPNPSERISFGELNDKAKKGLEECSKRKRIVLCSGGEPEKTDDIIHNLWPEKMIEL